MKIPYKENQFGFQYGAVEVTRVMHDESKGWVVLHLSTPRDKIEVYVTKTGKIRVFGIGKHPRGEWTLDES